MGHRFLEANKNKITPDENQLESFYYLIGELYFAQKKYDLALENLAKSKSTDNLVKLSIKRLYLKIFLKKEKLIHLIHLLFHIKHILVEKNHY